MDSVFNGLQLNSDLPLARTKPCHKRAARAITGRARRRG